MDRIFLGIDTSNYKTSIAAVDERGSVLTERSVLLDVPEGRRGLRQSEAFFKHSCRLPGLLAEIFDNAAPSSLAAIGVSERPRRMEGSYMPCFLAGCNLARELGITLGIPVYGFSHQESHAAAVLPETSDIAIFMHLSGGTTEFLLCEEDAQGYDMKIIGGTRDISIGQLIDRTGVACGFPFPSGPYLDSIAMELIEGSGPDKDADIIMSGERTGAVPLIRIKDGYFNLSGAETKILRYIESEGLRAESLERDDKLAKLSAEIFTGITELLAASIAYLTDKYGVRTVYLAGGVASSRSVRRLIIPASQASARADIRFGDPHLSGDNAVGTARLALRKHRAGSRKGLI